MTLDGRDTVFQSGEGEKIKKRVREQQSSASVCLWITASLKILRSFQPKLTDIYIHLDVETKRLYE